MRWGRRGAGQACFFLLMLRSSEGGVFGSSPAHFARLCKRLRRIYHARGLKSQDRVTDARSTRWTLPVPVMLCSCTAVSIVNSAVFGR